MKSVLVDILLAASVSCCWLACLGFARLRTPFDRMHCASFVNVVAVPLMVAAAFVADGSSQRAWKFLAAAAISFVAGGAGAHAAGRALWQRGDAE